MSWEKLKLGDVIDVMSGCAYKSKDFTDHGVPVIKITNITPPEVTLENLSYVPKEIADARPQFFLHEDDILIAMTGSHINQPNSVVGRVARVRYDAESVLNQRVGKIVVKDEEICDADFIYYFLSQYSVQESLASVAGGAANQANISATNIKNLDIDLPKIDEQKKISKVLRDYDDLIENNQKQIFLLGEAAQRIYKEWFVDMRFPGHENCKFVDGLPEGWRVGKLADIGEFRRGKTITKVDTRAGNIPVVAGGLKPAYYHNQYNAEAPVITVSGSGANAGFTRLYHENIWASDCSYLDRSNPDIFFVYCFLKLNADAVKAKQKGSAQPHVYAKDINNIEIIVPQEDVREMFKSVVKPYFVKLKNCENISREAREARDRLLPKLMSGEISV